MRIRQNPRLSAALVLLLNCCAACDGCGRTAPKLAPKPAHTATLALNVPAAQTYEVSGLSGAERRPLLIFLHGLGASGRAAFDSLRLAEFGARERVFVLAPDGTPDSQGRRFWNAGAACCNFDHLEIDDVARLAQLIDTWRARPDVDPARIYVMGHSNGGFMTERLACSLGTRIAGAVSLAGAAPPIDLPCPRTGTLALLEVHGDADKIVRYAGGTVFNAAELAEYPSAPQGFHDWAQRLGCEGAPERAPDLDLDSTLPGPETGVEQYRNCAKGSLELWTVHGGSHFVGMEPAAFQAIWRFLAAHHG